MVERFLEWDEQMGTIEKGMMADLVMLDANPLDDIRDKRWSTHAGFHQSGCRWMT